MTHRLKGGVLQERVGVSMKRPASSDHLETSDDANCQVCDDSNFATNMYREQIKNLFVRNKMSAKDIQETSSYSTGAGASGVHDIATAGKHGTLPGNVHRDIKKRFKKDSTMPQPYYAEIPI